MCYSDKEVSFCVIFLHASYSSQQATVVLQNVILSIVCTPLSPVCDQGSWCLIHRIENVRREELYSIFIKTKSIFLDKMPSFYKDIEVVNKVHRFCRTCFLKPLVEHQQSNESLISFHPKLSEEIH
ncbi:hypothetical protein XENORESO_006105 [Xenotaenia resolanae]|uniref:Uncharacterized protein n=1 Tax=Xenotaenia resolanae TaxID=208358 RepID=A0ABV0WMN3_9TELE